MKVEELKIKYPSGFEHAAHMTKEEIEHPIRLMAALKIFACFGASVIRYCIWQQTAGLLSFGYQVASFPSHLTQSFP